MEDVGGGVCKREHQEDPHDESNHPSDAKRPKTQEEDKTTPDDDFTPIPVDTGANHDDDGKDDQAAANSNDPMLLDPSTAEPMTPPKAPDATAPGTTATEGDKPAGVEPGMDTGRDITIKQEQFPVPLLDIEHFTNFPDDMPRKPGTKRYLDEPHPSIKSPISPFKEGKGSFSTGWWLAFHHYNRDLPEYANIRKDIICCNMCGAQVKRGERARATSALVQHLKTKIHRSVFDQLTVLWEGKARDPLVPRYKAPLNGSGTGFSGGPRKSLGSGRTKKSDLRAQKMQMRAVTRWIADTNQSMDVVESESFRQLVQVLQDTARVEAKASAKDVSEEMVTLDSEIRSKNRTALQGNMVWTTQGYSGTEASNGYQYLTAQFITESFQVESLMLEAKEQVSDAKAHTMASEYLEDTAAWGMKAGLVYALDNDAEVSNPGFVSSTEQSSSALGGQLEKNKGLLHVSFMDQKLSSTAEVALEFSFAEEGSTAPGTRDVLSKARELVAIFQQNGQRLADLKRMQDELPGEYKGQEPVGVTEDTEEYWWTIHDMIERLLKLRPALEKLWQEDRELEGSKMLDSAEWDILQQIRIVLKPLIMGVKALENEKVTAPLALVALNMVRGELTKIHLLSFDEQSNHDALLFGPTASKCAEQMLDHFDKTWGSLEEPFQGMKHRTGARNRQKGLHWSILMAYVLDPRFKDLPHIPNEKNKDAIWDAVLKEMVQAKKQSMKSSTADESVTAGGAQTDGEPPKDNAMMMYMMNASPGSKQPGEGASLSDTERDLKEKCSSEIDAYKAEDSPPLYDVSSGVATNPLVWWKDNHSRFPILWSLARVFLSIPISAASLEKQFGRTEVKNTNYEMAKERMNIRCNGLDAEPSQGPPAPSESTPVSPMVVNV